MFIYAKKELSEQLEHRGYKKNKGNDYYDVYVFDTRMMEIFESVDKDLYIKTNKLTF